MVLENAIELKIGSGTSLVRAGRHDEFWARVDAGEWEATTVSAIENLVPPGGTYIDIGAWIGPTVLLAARRAAKVIAYEPDPVSSEELLANLRLNDIQNVEVRRVALWVRDGELPFGPGSSADLGQRTSSLMYGQREGVFVRTCDALGEVASSAFRDCSLLKIDVEGAEYNLIPHIADYLQTVGPTLLLSTHGLGHISGRRGLAGRVVDVADLLVKRLRLMWVLRYYRYSYSDCRRNWLDKNATWKIVPKWRFYIESLRLRNQDYLFSNTPQSIDVRRG